MTIALIILGILFVALAWAAWHKLGDPVEDHEIIKKELAAARLREQVRNKRMEELREAYRVAKEELGEEPTVSQIFLTRDQLRTQKEL